MKIVVLDGWTLNPGDLSWQRLQALGEVTVYDRTDAQTIVERAAEADIVLTNKALVSAESISRLPRLQYIGVMATGYNNVDIQAAELRSIPVTNVPDYGTESVAQFTMALLLELCHHVGRHSDAVRDGEWSRSLDFCFTKSPLIELAGKTMGIIGMGRIGQHVARIASALGMHIMASARTPKSLPGLDNVRWASSNFELLEEADVISLHCPLTAETQGLINRGSLDKMKRNAFLINTSRGGLIADGDLASALNDGRIAGAGLDVLSMEPPASSNPLLSARNCIITPHIAWATKEARARLLAIAIDNVHAFIDGRPVNVVNRV